jgi:hypothetical protein
MGLELVPVRGETHIIPPLAKAGHNRPRKPENISSFSEKATIISKFLAQDLYTLACYRDLLAISPDLAEYEALIFQVPDTPGNGLRAYPELSPESLSRSRNRGVAASEERYYLKTLEVVGREHVSLLGCLLFMDW